MVASLLARSFRTSLPRYSAQSLVIRSLSTTRPTSFSSSLSVRETGGVSQQPGSKSFKELGQNALEETKGIGKVVLGAVSGSKVGEKPDTAAQKEGAEEANDSMGSLKSDVVSSTSVA